MYSRRSNVTGFSSGRFEDGRGHYFGDSSATAANVGGISQLLQDRRSFSPIRPGVCEVQPYISSTDVHISPESITVTPGRKTITIGRKESPQYSPRSYQLPVNAERQDVEDDGRRTPGRRPEMVYKTTMITQVAPRDENCGRDSPMQQQMSQRSDPRLLHISVEPTSPIQQADYVRYSSSPDLAPPTIKNWSVPDWPHQSVPSPVMGRGLGQTQYLQCTPDRIEISFQQPGRMQQQRLNQPYQDFNNHSMTRIPQQYYYMDQQQNFPPEDWRNRGDYAETYQRLAHHTPQTPPPEPQAVPSRVVYSPQIPSQNIAYSKRVEKKIPSHCSSIVIVPGGTKKVAAEDLQYQSADTIQMDQQRGHLHGDDREAEVDKLTNLLVQNMRMTKDPEFFGMCSCCGRAIMGSSNGCSALGQLYHVSCFTCGVCCSPLKQKSFFSLDGITFCEQCYSTSVEKCSECQEPITDKMLRAIGKQYHSTCFKCCLCRISLDGRAFTLDANGLVFCLEDFNRKYAPRCSGCGDMIIPREGKGEVERVVVMDRNYHLECHRCEDCGKLLSSRFGGGGCFPLDGSILCGRCNARRMEKLTNPASTSL